MKLNRIYKAEIWIMTFIWMNHLMRCRFGYLPSDFYYYMDDITYIIGALVLVSFYCLMFLFVLTIGQHPNFFHSWYNICARLLRHHGGLMPTIIFTVLIIADIYYAFSQKLNNPYRIYDDLQGYHWSSPWYHWWLPALYGFSFIPWEWLSDWRDHLSSWRNHLSSFSSLLRRYFHSF